MAVSEFTGIIDIDTAWYGMHCMLKNWPINVLTINSAYQIKSKYLVIILCVTQN